MTEQLFELGPIRPVDEQNSLLIRTTRSCPWNKCSFCVNYKDMPFSIRSVEDIKKDIEAAAEYYGQSQFESCFLQDGDSFIMKTEDLLEVLKHLKRFFPSLKNVSSYGRAQTMLGKSLEEMKELSDAGLKTLYCGMESGSDKVLKKIQKGISSDDLIKSGLMAREAGMIISEFIILGLGGKEHWKEHAVKTASVLNTINPDFIRVLTIGVKKGSDLEQQMQKGVYTLQSEKDLIEEQRLLIETLEGINSYYKNHHAVDLLMEAKGQLPEDKDRLLGIMDRYLTLPEEEQFLFTLGRRLGFFRYLMDLQNAELRNKVKEVVANINERYPDSLDLVCHELRERIV